MAKHSTQSTPKKTRARGIEQKTSAAATRARDWKPVFLTALARRGNVADACRAAKINRTTAYNHQQTDEVFAAAWLMALDEGADVLEAEAHRRAVTGVLKPVFGSGGTGMGTVEVGKVREYSDTLLIFLLKGARPEKYRDRIDHDHHFDKPIQFIEVVGEAATAASPTSNTGPDA